MANAYKAMETILNLDTKLSILPYKITEDGPGENLAQLFSCMVFTLDKKYEFDVPVEWYVDQLLEQDLS
jgi:hypothetical protein